MDILGLCFCLLIMAIAILLIKGKRRQKNEKSRMVKPERYRPRQKEWSND